MTIDFAEKFPYPTACLHERTEIRKKTFANGTHHFGTQCLDCGASVGRPAWMKHSDAPADAPPWEDDLSQSIWDAREKAKSEERAAKRKAWLERHDVYLQSPEWRALQAKVRQRDKGICQGCLDAPGTEVHHMTYDRWTRELLTDLVLFCHSCHTRFHEPPVGRE